MSALKRLNIGVLVILESDGFVWCWMLLASQSMFFSRGLGADDICPPSHQADECSTGPFFKVGPGAGRSPDAPSGTKNASGPVTIILKRRLAINLTPPRRVKTWRDSLLRLELCPETTHTRPGSWRWYHDRPKCDPSTGFKSRFGSNRLQKNLMGKVADRVKKRKWSFELWI